MVSALPCSWILTLEGVPGWGGSDSRTGVLATPVQENSGMLWDSGMGQHRARVHEPRHNHSYLAARGQRAEPGSNPSPLTHRYLAGGRGQLRG